MPNAQVGAGAQTNVPRSCDIVRDRRSSSQRDINAEDSGCGAVRKDAATRQALPKGK